MNKTIYTIGYEGAAIGAFLDALRENGVETVIDVRELPFSRKRDFSKRALAEQLDAAGVRYVHLKGLGTPKAGREAAKAGEMDAFRAIFAAQIAGAEGQADLRAAIGLAQESRACLLCLERDHKRCHRSIVADAMEKAAGFTVRHLVAGGD
ncbi:MAG: DUF488 family protein [Kiloniellales bacterium]